MAVRRGTMKGGRKTRVKTLLRTANAPLPHSCASQTMSRPSIKHLLVPACWRKKKLKMAITDLTVDSAASKSAVKPQVSKHFPQAHAHRHTHHTQRTRRKCHVEHTNRVHKVHARILRFFPLNGSGGPAPSSSTIIHDGRI